MELEKIPRGYEYLLFLQRTQGQLPALTPRDSQLPENSSSRGFDGLFWCSMGTCTYIVSIYTPRHVHNKTILL